MRTITRTGVTLSVIAALALYGVQLVAALGVVVGIILTGALAGLSVAKWLERDWYGRQFAAGARAGLIACGVGGLSSLLYLLGQGPRSLPELAAHSHLLGIDLAPLVMMLGALGWSGVDIVMILGAIALGVMSAALIAQIVGWSKSGRAVRVIAQARLAAQALQRVDSRGVVTAGPRSSTLGPQLYATGAPVSSPPRESSDWDGLGLPGASSPGTPRPRLADAPAPQPSPAPRPAAIHYQSDARATKEALTEEARIALSNWEDELDGLDGLDGFEEPQDESKTATERRRAPNPSAFLTSPPPVKPRKRKRKDSGDWLC
jgi:hypothetical protein